MPYAPIFEERQRKAYTKAFWNTIEPVLKSITTKNKVSYNSKESVSEKAFSYKKEIELTNSDKKIIFFIEILPWNWNDGSLLVKIDLKDTKNILLPKKRIKQIQTTPQIWTPGNDKFILMKALEPVSTYIKIMELTTNDVGLFDNIGQLIKNLFSR